MKKLWISFISLFKKKKVQTNQPKTIKDPLLGTAREICKEITGEKIESELSSEKQKFNQELVENSVNKKNVIPAPEELGLTEEEISEKEISSVKPSPINSRKIEYSIQLAEIKPNTKRRKLLHYLLDKGSITSEEAKEKFSITRLPAEIYFLKTQGIKFKTEYFTTTETRKAKYIII